ncbi:hypothetical protein [Brevibacillus formosus]|uniref:hypothetical protein n=1 Tax=Brevibacillus formosus TaxID=54913 RepID=UPI003F1D62E4
MTELSEKAKGICHENYGKNCGKCPIRPKCTASVGPGRDALERWTNSVNEAAIKVDTQAQLS